MQKIYYPVSISPLYYSCTFSAKNDSDFVKLFIRLYEKIFTTYSSSDEGENLTHDFWKDILLIPGSSSEFILTELFLVFNWLTDKSLIDWLILTLIVSFSCTSIFLVFLLFCFGFFFWTYLIELFKRIRNKFWQLIY